MQVKNFVKIKNNLSFRIKFFTILFLLFTLCTILSVNYTLAQGTGLEEAANKAGLKTSEISIPTIIGKIIQEVLGFIGLIFFILILYGGFMWMTAGGNEEKVTKAKSLITQATIGLIIVITAYAISYYITYTLLRITQ